MDDVTKYCVDCKYYLTSKQENTATNLILHGLYQKMGSSNIICCIHLANMSIVDKLPKWSPEELRYEKISGCGFEGHWWEAKE